MLKEKHRINSAVLNERAKYMKAIITDVKRFATHDGDGIRTTVFLKGCPLKCVWCHNPESISPNVQLAYYEHKCISCGMCVNVCENKAHIIADDKHVFERNLCVACGKCEALCLGDALKIYGKEYSADELSEILTEDKAFYDNSGGGVTLSGGECLIQADFCAELLKKLKDENINTAIDTCGFVPKESFDKVMPYTDVFLYDIKAMDEDVHIKCTGQSNKLILENIRYLDSQNKAIEVRIPYIPNYNDKQIDKITDFLCNLKNVRKVKVLPYHNYAGSKYAALNINNTLPKVLPTDSEIQTAEKIICNKLKRI